MKLLDYIRGQRKGKEAHRLEKEAMKDPFLADAMDGYQIVEGNHEEKLSNLRKQLSNRTYKKRNYAMIWSIAASLLIGISISGYFLFQKDTLTEKQYTEDKAIDILFEEELIPIEPKQPDIMAKVSPKDTAKKSSSGLVSENRKSKQITPLAASPALQEESLIAPIAEEAEEADLLTDDISSTKAISRSSISKEIKGKVTDKNGEPLPGASVMIENSNIGTVADTDGNFTLRITGNEKLHIDYIGYEPVTLPVDTGKNMLIAMNEDHQALDEAVITKYTKRNSSPEPVIGKKEYKKYLENHLIRPTDNECTGVKGKVIITFLVNESGRPYDFIIKKSLCPSADKEAIRLIKEGPDWTHGNKRANITVKF